MRSIKLSPIVTGIIGLVIGVVIILVIRFATYSAPEQPHYHANFAVYINGTREPFKGRGYYEETAAEMCSLQQVETSKQRAHMHDNVGDVVHVEDHLVSWGNFMQNLGWGLGNDYLKTNDKMFVNGDAGTLSFILNGQKVDSISDQIIQDKDRLLISYGTSDTTQLQEQYTSVANTAATYDSSKDPASCGGSGRAPVTALQRLQHLF
jgi:hypothetical protein